MSRWFRFYDDALNDPKILKLSDSEFRSWVGLLCVASKEKGALPSADALGFYLRMKPQRVAALIVRLVSAGLLDKEVDSYVPHNWSERQYVSDGSAGRVKRYREKREAAGLPGQWWAPPALRKQIYTRDGHECVYCGSPDNLTLDHKTPAMRGGSNEPDNLQTCCRACNAAKRDMTHDEYMSRNAQVTLLKRPHITEAEQNRADADGARDVFKSDSVEGDLRQSIVRAFAEANSPNLPETSRAGLWISQGYEPAIILAVVAEGIKKKPSVGSLAYFDRAIAEAHAGKNPKRKDVVGDAAIARAAERAAAKVHVKVDTPQWRAWTKFLGKPPAQDRNFGWLFDTEWPPGYGAVPAETPQLPSMQ